MLEEIYNMFMCRFMCMFMVMFICRSIHKKETTLIWFLSQKNKEWKLPSTGVQISQHIQCSIPSGKFYRKLQPIYEYVLLYQHILQLAPPKISTIRLHISTIAVNLRFASMIFMSILSLDLFLCSYDKYGTRRITGIIYKY